MKKVLIVVYYWPPSGGSGVQRWLKFVKYLPQFGIEPHVYTVENGEFHALDESLAKDIPKECVVIRRPIIEPFGLYRKFLGKKDQHISPDVIIQSKKGGLRDKFALWVRSNIFIPDARMLWVRPSVTFLEDYLKKEQIDTIITSGPPMSMHLIGLRLKKKMDIIWIADFRDPWTKLVIFKDFSLTQWAKNVHAKLEEDVVKSADAVVTVGQQIKEDFENMFGRHVDLITNGYDEDDFTPIDDKDLEFTIVHTGTLYLNANPDLFWEVIADLVQEQKMNNFKIKLYGKTESTIISRLKTLGLINYLEEINYIEHSEINKIQQKARLLILPIAGSSPILTGKFFEYLASGSRILGIGNSKVNYEIANLISQSNSGVFINANDREGLKTFILEEYNKGIYKNTVSDITIKYSRKELTRKMAELVDKLHLVKSENKINLEES
jgi:hypothetical protein